MTNSNEKSWDAAHTVIGFISLNGLYAMSKEKFSEICQDNGVDFSGVKSKVKTHYRMIGDSFKYEYISSI